MMESRLDNSETFTTLFDQTYDQHARAVMRFVENDVYLAVYVYPDGGPYAVTILKIDTATGDAETVYEESGSPEGFSDIWVTKEQEVYFTCGSSLWKIDNGRRVETAIFTEKGSPLVMDGIAVNTYAKDNIEWVEIKNFDGETVYNGKLFTAGIPEIGGGTEALESMSRGIVGGDADKLILTMFEFADNQIHGYTIMLDLHNNLNPTLLWAGVE